MVTMSQKELRRLHFVRNALGKVITQREAAEATQISEREIRRLIKRVREEGDRGLIHRSRGRPSNHAIDAKVKTKALDLFKTKYPDFGPTLAAEKLFEKDKINLSDETLRLWLIKADIPYKQRKKRPHREWRERKHYLGEMIQTDGSHHDWFEGRAPKCVLMGYIDDATGKPFARFEPYEGTLPAMRALKGYIVKYGIPGSLYLDKHMIYRAPRKQTIEEELSGTHALSHFERACEGLGINVIHANSPQAKGRIERLFGTFQDRLIKEMRLANVSGMEEGNRFLRRYLPIYFKRFGVPPAREGDMHRPLPKGIDLNRILCKKTERLLRNDFTVAHEGQLYQVLDNIRAQKVVVEERMDGTMVLQYGDLKLKYKLITARSQKPEPKLKKQAFRIRKTWIPPSDHPWRHFILESRPKNTEELVTAQA